MRRTHPRTAAPVLALGGTVFLAGAALAATIRVPGDLPTIQAAIDSSAPGDTVLVSPGVYRENLDFRGKSIEVVGEAGPEATVIDGGEAGPVVVFAGRETGDTVLRGFTIRNGRIDPDAPWPSGGQGIRIGGSSPTIVGNHIVDNEGCGIDVYWGSPRIAANRISRNGRRCFGGGGIRILGRDPRGIEPAILSNVVSENLEGGIMLSGVDRAIVANNTIARNTTLYRGGGVSVNGHSPIDLVQNLIVENFGGSGGGIYLSSLSDGARVVANTVVANESPDGSALRIDVFPPDTEIVNNVLAASAGETVVLCGRWPAPGLGAFRSNDVFSFSGERFGGSCSDSTGSDGNLGADPRLACIPGGDFRPVETSPCVDAAEGGVSGLPRGDLEGNPRLADGDADGEPRLDIGALELQPGSPPAPCAYVFCPPDVLALVERGETAGVVEYPTPWAGPDSTVTCTPASASVLPLGRTAVECAAIGPAGDAASCAFAATVDVHAPNDDFDDATPVTTLPFTDSVYTGLATWAPDDPYCSGSGETIWYSLVVDENQWITVDTLASDFPTRVSAYAGDRGVLEQLSCGDGQIRFRATAEERYSVMVGSAVNQPGGHLELSITAEPALNVRVLASPVGTIHAPSGEASVEGTVTCTFPADARVYALLTQERAPSSVEVFAGTRVACDGETEWSIDLPGGDPSLRAGPATLLVFATAWRQETFEDAWNYVSGPVRLNGAASGAR